MKVVDSAGPTKSRASGSTLTSWNVDQVWIEAGGFRRRGECLEHFPERLVERDVGRDRVALLTRGMAQLSELGIIVSETDDGRIRLDFWDDEPDGVDAFVKALRRSP